MFSRTSLFVTALFVSALAAPLPAAPAVASPALAAPSAAASASASDSGVPDADALLAKVRAAAGPVSDNVLRVVMHKSGTTDVTVTTQRIGDDSRTDVVEGPLHFVSGTVKGQDWHQNENGQTVLDNQAAGKEKEVEYKTTVKRVATPIAGFAISALDERGYGARSFIDGATMRIVRRESIDSRGTAVTSYSDFRTVGGHTRAYAWSVDEIGHVVNYNLLSETYDAVKTSDLAVPPPRRALVEFPAGQTAVQLPVTCVDNTFVIRVDVGGRGLDFIPDSGAAGIVIDEGIARELNLTEYGNEYNNANAHGFLQHEAVIPEVHVGPITMHDVAVSTVPTLGIESPGRFKIVGLLGFDFIAETMLKLDYQRGVAFAYDPDHFDFPKDEHPVAVPIRLGNGTPTTDVMVNGNLGENFLLDTGAQGSILVNDSFLRRYPNALVGYDRYGTETFRGAGGEFEAIAYRFKSVGIGMLKFLNFLGYRITQRGSYEGDDDGVIGSEFLRFYTVYFDYGYSHVYFERNNVRE